MVLPARILRRWDINSGSELQLRLERRTYLISTLLGFSLGAGAAVAVTVCANR